uniref:Odorant receptor n=1 Tax=Aulacocentrum confusum TaxID=2767324 RepID=A0A7G8Z979_9HYME|nr:olfactory receptor 60 [Aulacocentrum confusum]
MFCLFLFGFLKTGGMIAAWCDPPIFMESIAPVLISLMCVVKFINFIYNSEKMKALLDTLNADWASLTDENELKILNRWALDSRKNTIFYAGAVYGSMAPFMLGPLVPLAVKMLPDGLLPMNMTMSQPLMFHVEYLIDADLYYLPLVIHSYFGTWTYITVVVAIDSMFMVYVQHACAIFDLIGYRLAHLVTSKDILVNIKPKIIDDKAYERVVQCIIRHSETLKYAQMIESANSLSFLLQLMINMITISFTSFQAATKLNRPDEAFRYASFTIAQTFHLFFESWPSQRLADESARICEYTTRSLWYLTSLRSRKVLQLLIMRSLQPCQLTAGGFYNLNLENFSSVIKMNKH